MSATPTINLFQSQTEVHPIVRYLTPFVRSISSVSFIIFLMVGTSIFTIRWFVQNELKSIADQTNNIMAQIKAETTKEGMLLDLHHRIALVSSVRKTQISFAPYLDATLAIARPPGLTSLGFGENNQVRITVKVLSLSEASDVIDSVINLLTKKKIRNPFITSFAIDANGLIVLGLSYDVILNSL